MHSDPTFTILLAGAAITIGAAVGALWARRVRWPIQLAFWQVLAFGWAILIVMGFVFVLVPDNASSVVFALAFLFTGAGMLAAAMRERRRVSPPPSLTTDRLNRAIFFGALQMGAGVVLLLMLSSQR
jgi:hypothetical protein